MLCPQCNGSLPEGAGFCPRCGSPASSARAATPNLPMVALDGATAPASSVDSPSPDRFSFSPDQVRSMVDQTTLPINESAEYGGLSGDPNQRETCVLLLDASGSMTEQYNGRLSKVEAAGKAGRAFVYDKEACDPDDQVGLITFNTRATVVLSPVTLRTGRDQLIQALRNLRAGGGTDFVPAAEAADHVLRSAAPDAVGRMVLLTDGHAADPRKITDAMKQRGVVIDVIGIGPDPAAVNETVLKNVASVIQGQLRYRFIRDARTLINHFTTLSSKTSTY